jgi:putative oxidoreductase
MANSSLLVASAASQRIGIALLRVVTGLVFAMHGGQKLFVYGFAGVTGAFTRMGVPMPGLMGPFAALLEFFGGLALIIGLLTRLAAFGLALDMIGAILLVHLAGGFFLPSGYEFVLTLGAMALSLVLTGPGAFSIDEVLARRRSSNASAGLR